ncbi:MAG: DegT/DnrJ/EryC1/StrS family aminotransferase [Planctomycetota bacterium]
MIKFHKDIPHSKPTIGPQEIEAVGSALRSNYLAQGQLVLSFEKNFAGFIGMKYALATNSGTSALHLALLSLGVSKKSEVILPSYTCSAVLNAVNYAGARPVVVDINETDGNINPRAVQKKLSRRTRAIIVPHLAGWPARINEFQFRNIPVIEDCAQSLGALYKNKPVGAFGAISIFSFYATKMMTTGYGGMLLTDSPNLFKRALDLREFDNRRHYTTRFNYQMSNFQAALGAVQLARLPRFIRRRREIAHLYNISGIFSALIPSAQTRPVFHRYILRISKNPNGFIKKMAEKGIEVKRPVFRPLHHYLKLNQKDFPVTEEIYRTFISLPIYPALTNRAVKYIAGSTREILTRL